MTYPNAAVDSSDQQPFFHQYCSSIQHPRSLEQYARYMRLAIRVQGTTSSDYAARCKELEQANIFLAIMHEV
jgi:hypothetical protein